MQLTIDIPDKLYRQVKAASQDQGMEAFLLEAIHDKLHKDNHRTPTEPGWKVVFGKADPADVAEVQQMIDEEFSL